MGNLLFYILSVGVCLSLFVIVFQIFLRNNTRFNLCRFFLIASILLSFLIPSIPIDLGIKSFYTDNKTANAEVELIDQVQPQIITAEPVLNTDQSWDIDPVKTISIFLLSISLLLFIRFIVQFGSIILIQSSGNRLEVDGGVNLIFTDKTDNAFSFLGNIFINPLKFNDEEKRLIIDHEREHIRHFHSVDLILIELLIVLQWFNPFAYIARRKLIEIHEFIADNGVIHKGADPYSYQNLLLSVVTSSCLPSVGNQLSAFITKKRIAMIGKPLNQTGQWINFLILIPIAVILIIGISAFSPNDPIRLDTIKSKLTASKQLETVKSTKESNNINVAEDNPKAIEIKNISTTQGKSIIANENEKNLEPLKRVEVSSSLLKETKISISPISQQDMKEELLKRAQAEIKETYLKYFYLNFSVPHSGSSTNLSLNASTTRYSVILKKECIYNLYYFSGSKDDKLMAIIGSGSGDESVIEQQFNFSYFLKKTIEPKVTGAYHLEINNLSSKKTEVLMYLTLAEYKENCSEAKGKQFGNIGFTNKEPSKNSNVEQSDTLANKAVTQREDDEPFLVVEQMPSFGNGNPDEFRAWVNSNIQYPKIAADNGIQGRVYVQFIVAKDGSVRNPKVIRGVDPSIDKEALRIMGSSPKWNPGIQRGKPVNVSYTFPITFTLKETKNANQEQVLEMQKVDTLANKAVTQREDDEPFLVVEQMPSFGNGNPDEFRAWINSNMQYPKESAEKGIQGRVYLQFVISKEGKLIKPKVVRGVDPLLDAEAIRVVSNSPIWNPGMQRGEPVNVSFTFPITFILN